MQKANQIQLEIIDMIKSISDLDRLLDIHSSLQTKPQKLPSPAFEEAITEIRSGVTFEQELSNQKYVPITYDQFGAIAEKIQWEQSLDDLLAVL
ncbi:MAG: hypothetical protein AAGF87_01185 [Bacteroidota bacterium]